MSPNGGHLFCEKIKLKNNFVLQKTKKKKEMAPLCSASSTPEICQSTLIDEN